MHHARRSYFGPQSTQNGLPEWPLNRRASEPRRGRNFSFGLAVGDTKEREGGGLISRIPPLSYRLVSLITGPGAVMNESMWVLKPNQNLKIC